VDKIWAPETLALFLAFFVPGFVMATVWSAIIPLQQVDFGKDVPRLVGYSVLHYAGTLWLVFAAPAGVARLIAAYLVVLVLPAVWPPLIIVLRDRERWLPRLVSGEILKYMINAQPRPWDDTFDALQAHGGCWVRIRLKSGTWIGGTLGKGSRYSTYPDNEQIYLAEEIRFDERGNLIGVVSNTKGLLVAGQEIEFMEFLA
jgi:Family of unknown function (DUF6338)